ncbi:MAG: IS3 family transposase [Bacteroidales bacterium]|nr:IS3 family transposase [Bacteroidales bacterium]
MSVKNRLQKKIRCQTVDEMRQEPSSYRIDAFCRPFGKSRQAYDERSHYVATTSVEEDTILSLVRTVREDFPRMGARKLLICLKPKFEAMHLHIGRDAFIELLYRNFMLVRKVKNRRKTTFSNHWMHKYPNLTSGYTPSVPNRLWVSDITYIETGGAVGYLSLITDAYSHKIVGWNLSRTLRSPGALSALKMALGSLSGKQPELIHHSDRGSQYCCRDYVNMLHRRNIRISMTENGDPLENAVAERVNGILKTEWIYDGKPESWQKTVAFVGRIIDLYNNQRPHQSIGYMVPAEVHQTGMKTERMWKNYYRSRNIPMNGNMGENKDSVPEQDGMKNSCPEKEEQKTLHQGNEAKA